MPRSLLPSLRIRARPLHAGGSALLLAAGLAWHAAAWPADLLLVGAPAGGPYDEFVQQLHLQHARQARPGSRLRIADPPPSAAAADSPLAGIRTRSLPPAARRAPGDADASRPSTPLPGLAPPRYVKIAVGPRAARALLDDATDRHPLLLTLLSRMDYEALRSHPAMRQPLRPIAVLLREPDIGLQLALARAILPPGRRLGVIASPDIDPLVQELLQAAGGDDIAIGYAADAAALADTLRDILPRADALLILSETLGNDAAAGWTLLHAAAAARKPAFAVSEASVRAGALAAAVATQAQLARQTLALGDRLSMLPASATPPAAIVERPHPVSVRVNARVADSLGLAPPDAASLADRINAAR